MRFRGLNLTPQLNPCFAVRFSWHRPFGCRKFWDRFPARVGRLACLTECGQGAGVVREVPFRPAGACFRVVRGLLWFSLWFCPVFSSGASLPPASRPLLGMPRCARLILLLRGHFLFALLPCFFCGWRPFRLPQPTPQPTPAANATAHAGAYTGTETTWCRTCAAARVSS